MKKDEVNLAPIANLVIAKPIRRVEMKALVEAARLLLDGKTGDDALAYVHREALAYKFAQPDFEKPRIATLMPEWQTWQAAGILFGQKFEECPDKEHLLPYLLVMLCGDLLDNQTSDTVYYSSEDCGYTEKDGVITIKLSKSLDYCSYHDLTATFSKSGFEVAIEGCWRGTQQDPGPVYHPKENLYRCIVRFHTSSSELDYCLLWGKDPKEGLTLWGIDLGKLVTFQKEPETA